MKNSKINTSEIWLSVDETSIFLGKKKRTIRDHCLKGRYEVEKIESNGGLQYRIRLSSLPVACQTKYLENLNQDEAEDREQKPERRLNDKQKKIALAKAKLLRNYTSISGEKLTQQKQGFIELYNQGNIFPDVFGSLGEVNYKSVERWKKTWLENKKDYTALAPAFKYTKQSTVTPEEAKILIKYALTPNNPPIRQCARSAVAHFVMRNFPNVKSIQTYVRWLKNYKKNNYDVWTLIREGEKALDEKAIKSILRDYDKIEVGDIMVADGHKLNFEIIDPATGKYRRMNLILFYDMKSNMPLGWEISITENTEAIAMALYRSIVRLGKFPRLVYLDNGRAFVSKYFTGDSTENNEIIGLFERCGISVITARPYNAKAKTIERFFETFAEVEMRMPTYCGTSIEKKPPRMMRNEKFHKKLYDNMMNNISIDIWTAHEILARWFDEYSERKQQSGHLKNVAPMSLFSKGIGSGVDKAQLVWLMMEKKELPVYANGIRLFGRYYWNDELYGYKGKVTVKYDIIDREVIYLFDESGKSLGGATYDPLVHPAAGPLGSAEDVEELQRQSAQQKELKRLTKAKAKYLLQNDMADSIDKSVERAIEDSKKLANKKGTSSSTVETPKKRSSIFDSIDVEIIDETPKKTGIFYKKTAEA